MMRRVFVLVAFLSGCSAGDFETAPGTEDSATADSTSSDSSGADSPLDSTLDDSAADSTSTPDSHPSDSGAFDSNPVDGATDTHEASLPDVAGGCPAPVSMEPPMDVSTMTCEDLEATYPTVVNAAKACGCEADCSQEVPRDFCMCPTIVSPAAPAFPSLAAMRKRWTDLGCTIICPKVACKDPVLTGCFPSSGGTSGTVCTSM
jgi:hypothetical protein